MPISTSDTDDRLRGLKTGLVADALAEGFDVARVARADAIPETAERLDRFLAEGRHGAMDWMARTADRRRQPRALWPEVRSVAMLGLNYGPDADPMPQLAERDGGYISVYARGDDYHDLVKKRLKAVARRFCARAGAEVKVFVDTAPVMEKPLAAAAGLGWQGKHTNLLSREFGNWLFLGAIFTDAELPEDEPEADRCGSCRACLDACPTDAFPAPYQLDARRCISYLTIEHAGPIPHEFRAAMGNRIYGCDDCLAVCPWNKFARRGREARLAAREALTMPRLDELAELDDPSFRALFTKSPVKRSGVKRFLRNVMIAIGNSGDERLVPSAKRRLTDDSAVVRGAAVWALSRLLARDAVVALSERHLPHESDEEVREEWRIATTTEGQQTAGGSSSSASATRRRRSPAG